MTLGAEAVSGVAGGRRSGVERGDVERPEASVLARPRAVLETVCRGRASRTQNAAQERTYNDDPLLILQPRVGSGAV